MVGKQRAWCLHAKGREVVEEIGQDRLLGEGSALQKGTGTQPDRRTMPSRSALSLSSG